MWQRTNSIERSEKSAEIIYKKGKNRGQNKKEKRKKANDKQHRKRWKERRDNKKERKKEQRTEKKEKKVANYKQHRTIAEIIITIINNKRKNKTGRMKQKISKTKKGKMGSSQILQITELGRNRRLRTQKLEMRRVDVSCGRDTREQEKRKKHSVLEN